MIKTICPHCKQTLQIPDQYAGQSGTCKHCQNKITVPHLAGDILIDNPVSPPAAKQRPPWLPYAFGAVLLILIGAGFILRPKNSPEPIQIPPVDVATTSAPDPATLAKSPGEQLDDAQRLVIREKKYREGINTFEKIRAEHPDAVTTRHGLYFALAYAALDDHDGHEQLCQWLLDRFSIPQSPIDAERVAKAYLLYPGADNPALFTQAEKLTLYAVNDATGKTLLWNFLAHGMANYRLQRYTEAKKWLEKAFDKNSPGVHAQALAYTALTQIGLGNEAAAREILKQLKNDINTLSNPNLKNDKALELAINEAESLLPPILTAAVPIQKSPEEQINDALALASEGKLPEALGAFEKVRNENPHAIQAINGLHFATAYAVLGDREKYNQLCRWLLTRFENSDSIFDKSCAIKACLILPGTNDQQFLKTSVIFTKSAIEEGPDDILPWAYVSHGIINYRLKRYEDAKTSLEKMTNSKSSVIRAQALAYNALAELGLRNENAARNLIKRANSSLIESWKLSITNSEITKLALNEAHTLLGKFDTTSIPEPVTKSPEEQIMDAQKFAAQGKYRNAIEAFEKVQQSAPTTLNSYHGNQMAVLYAQLGEQEKHEALCRWMLKMLPLPQAPSDAERPSKAYILYPGAKNKELLDIADTRTKYAVDNAKGGALSWFNVSVGMTQYRLKQYREASKWLEKESGGNNIFAKTLALTYSAMAEFARDNKSKAREVLADARSAVANLPQHGTEKYRNQWSNILTSKLALAEAETLINTHPIQLVNTTKPIHFLPTKNLDRFTPAIKDRPVGEDPDAVFKLLDGVLIAKGSEQGFLFTNNAFENYKLEIEYKWETNRPDRDSGIFVNIPASETEIQRLSFKVPAIEVNLLGPKRMKSEISLSGMIWLYSPQGDRVNLTVDGKIHTKNTSASTPPEDLENPLGEWNTIDITNDNGEFNVYLNGKIAVEGTNPIPSQGKIVLQSSRGEIHFRKMTLTPLN